MEFFNSAVDVLKTLVVALGAGLGVWGAVNLMEGYGGDKGKTYNATVLLSCEADGRSKFSLEFDGGC